MALHVINISAGARHARWKRLFRVPTQTTHYLLHVYISAGAHLSRDGNCCLECPLRQNLSYNRWSTFTVICNIFLQRWMFTSLSGPEFRLFFHHKQHTTWISTTEHLNCNRNFFTLTGKHPSNRVTAKYWNCWSINPHQHEDEVSGETPAGKPRGKRELWWDPSGRGKTEILYWTKETYIEREIWWFIKISQINCLKDVWHN